MPFLFSNSAIQKFETDAEQDFATSRPCIIDRVSLDIISGTEIYDIPSYVTNIRRVTYRGWKLFPMPHRDLRQSFLSGTQGGRPYWYIFNNIGQSQIKLFPVPQENISMVSDTSTLWGSHIIDSFIIEFFRLPDTGFAIPDFIRRQLLKTYISKRLFQMEGKGVKLKTVRYMNQKFEMLKQIDIDLLDDLNNKPRNLMANNQSSKPYGVTPPPPVLPINRYGIAVDDMS
jgi:hypothetical protein